jgi:hypothetical protein
LNYIWYVDDILLIYNSQHTDLHSILYDFNPLHQNLHFTGKIEPKNNTINYLDISIHKTPANVKISVYRKPTFTDTIIPYTSNHPTQHKFAAVRFLYNRLNTYQLQPAEYQEEENIIHNVLHSNAFPIQPPKNHPTNPSSLREKTCSTALGHIHIHRQRNYRHHKTVQARTHKNSLLH